MSQLLNKNLHPSMINKNDLALLGNNPVGQLEKLENFFPPTSLTKSFSHAFYGIKETWLYERNFKIHTICAAVALFLAFALKIDLFSWIALILVISFVLMAELINTALEHLVDLAANSHYHPLAKTSKDAAAGAVLIASLSALLCGVLIFTPRLKPLVLQLFSLITH